MVQILQAYKEPRGIFLEFLVNEIQISSLVTNCEGKTAQEIITEGFDLITPAVEQECVRLGVEFDSELPIFIDDVVRMEVIGAYPVECLQGTDPLVINFSALAITKLGNEMNVTEYCSFSTNLGVISRNTLTLTVTESTAALITGKYQQFANSAQLPVTFISFEQQDERAAERARHEAEMLAAQLASAKQSKIVELDASCSSEILSGFVCNIKGEDRAFGFDLNDQMNLTGKLTMLNANPSIESVIWKCKGLEGQLDVYSTEEFNQICVAADAAKTAKIGTFWTKKNAVLAAMTVEEVNEIVW